jgi:hypothetical protein
MRMTDTFTWEELPTRCASTGYLTKAGYIPIIEKLSKYAVIFVLGFHAVQCAYRIAFYHDMVFTAWHFAPSSVSPIYEIANATQVTFQFQYSQHFNFFQTFLSFVVKSSF